MIILTIFDFTNKISHKKYITHTTLYRIYFTYKGNNYLIDKDIHGICLYPEKDHAFNEYMHNLNKMKKFFTSLEYREIECKEELIENTIEQNDSISKELFLNIILQL